MVLLRYTIEHEWVRLDGDTATVGITDYAQQSLGDVVFVELPEAGRDVHTGEACAVVESVKAASDVFAPFDGHVLETNPDIVTDPSLVNRSPHEQGWFFRMAVADPAAAEKLMDADAYAAYLKTL
ncbi:MAG: glycine cleavage system protein GcvH [Alphaproteobacteria bacterium]|nr:glycine cleavage system protein GcvH [Alphaproteobacteria bacterium]